MNDPPLNFSEDKPMAVTIVISNRKGGTGKTTVSVNVAAEMAALGLRVLLVDLDSQGHCAVGVGIKVGKGTPTVHDIFRSADARLATAVQPTAFNNLALVPADPLFEHGEGLRDEGLLKRALAEADIVANFDVVILDTPPSLDILLLKLLRCQLGGGALRAAPAVERGRETVDEGAV
jgi:chromosome partitioning protein